MYVKYTSFGYIYISPDDDCEAIVDVMIDTDYDMEFCLAESFDPDFVSRLMKAGFLVMSMNLSENPEDPHFLLLPKLHLVRSALFFENLHIKKSIKRLLGRYELRFDTDFDYIINRCVEKHGADWLTPPLVKSIREVRKIGSRERESGTGDWGLGTRERGSKDNNSSELSSGNSNHDSQSRSSKPSQFSPSPQSLVPSPILTPTPSPYPTSFALYRNNKLVAGEFGVICGKVYTSYSGFYDEDNAGTVQIILMTQYLQKHGFAFLDMGMPLDYKTQLGSNDISPGEFVVLFRSAQS